jgi:hypothetical protein
MFLVPLLGAANSWRDWWAEGLSATPFWRTAIARFAWPIHATELPRSLLERFVGGDRERLIAALRFLSPITTRRRFMSAG